MNTVPLVCRSTIYRSHHSSDVNEHATRISDWRQEYDQLSCGHFKGMVRELWLHTPRLQVFHEFTGPQTSQRCQPWAGSVWFGIPDGIVEGTLHFSGQRQEGERLRMVMAARAGEGFMLRTPQCFGIYGVVADEQWLGVRLSALGLDPVLPGRHGVRAAPLPAHRHASLCQTIESMLALGASGEARQAWGQHALRLLSHQLLHLVGACGEDVAQAATSTHQAQRRLAMVVAAHTMAADPCSNLVSVEDLCQRLHLTPRTLHNYFQSAVGESPAEFLRAVRLNACRRRLRNTGAHLVTIQEVAAQWGFFHMGRFAQEYRLMFGELPSQTLHQVRLAAPH